MSQRKRKRPAARPGPQHTQDRSTPQAATSNVSTSPPMVPAQPTPDDAEGWKAYWEKQEQPWRRKPKIPLPRQQELARRYALVPDVEQGRYRLGGIKLNRADAEWLLATYNDQLTPEKGLDVRGAILDGEDLSDLSLNGLLGGLTAVECIRASEEQYDVAAVHMKHVKLQGAQLENAQLS